MIRSYARFGFTGECQWLHLELIKEMHIFCKSLFPVVDYAYCTIPTYPSGQIGFILCSKNPVNAPSFQMRVYVCVWKSPEISYAYLLYFPQDTNFRQPVRELTRDEIKSMELQYYNPEIHQAAFILPEFARKVNVWRLQWC